MKRLAVAAVLLVPCLAHGGAFIFTEQEINGAVRPDIVTHPQGVGNTGGTVSVKVCIVPNVNNANPRAGQMQVAIQNIVDRYNLGVPATPNLRFGADNEIANNQVDFESVALHEIGHCQGLNHSNAASESGLSDVFTNYTKALRGTNGVFDLNDGSDNIIGSADDRRGDDINLHYFEIGVNDPFRLPSIVDELTYSRDLDDLPTGDRFAANADRDVGRLVYGTLDTEAVMQQLTFTGETQRALSPDDLATLQYARAGFDRRAGTGDDYQVVLEYGGISDSSTCDINVAFDDSETGFAVCFSGTNNISLGSEPYAVLSQADVFFSTNANWFFSSTRIPRPVRDEGTLFNGDTLTVVNGNSTSLLDNDTHPAGAGLVVTPGQPVAAPAHGVVTLANDGTFSYVHDGSGPGSDRFVYEVCVDGNAEACSHQYVDITISEILNASPVAVADSLTVAEGGTVAALDSGADSLLANDSDPDGDALSVSVAPITAPTAGELVLNPNGTFSYAHDGSEVTEDGFAYQVCDDGDPQLCATGSVTIQITEVNDPPIAADDTLSSVDEDRSAFTIDDATLLANDDAGESGQSLTLTAIANPVGGTAVISSGNVRFTPAADFSGEASFEYTVRDNGTTDGASDPQTDMAVARFTIVAVNDPPTANPDQLAAIDEDSAPITIAFSTLLANDEPGPPAESSQTLLISAVSNAVGGSVAFDGPQVVFTPAPDFNGTASFDYTIQDNGRTGGQSDPLSDTATVSFTVNPVDDLPVAHPDAIVVLVGTTTMRLASGADTVLANDQEGDGDPLTTSVVSAPTHGDLTLEADGRFSYSHTGTTIGTDSFDYQVCDGGSCAQATVTVQIIDGTFAQCAHGGRRVLVGLPASIDAAASLAGDGFAAIGLPASLSIQASTGLITGTPTTGDLPGSPYAVTVSNNLGDQSTLLITVEEAPDALFLSDFERDCQGL